MSPASTVAPMRDNTGIPPQNHTAAELEGGGTAILGSRLLKERRGHLEACCHTNRGLPRPRGRLATGLIWPLRAKGAAGVGLCDTRLGSRQLPCTLCGADAGPRGETTGTERQACQPVSVGGGDGKCGTSGMTPTAATRSNSAVSEGRTRATLKSSSFR